jgi:pimeloyl-ACP methyl ester carboxylesterase
MLGQFVMRQFPQILEAAVFDGTRPVANTSWSQFEAPGKQGGLDELTRLCAKDAKCAAAYDIPALLDKAAALFKDGPVAVTIPDPADDTKTLHMTVTLDDLAGFVNQLLASRVTASALPYYLNIIAKGDLSLVAGNIAEQIPLQREATKGDVAILQHLAMVCSDDPDRSTDQLVTKGAGPVEIDWANLVTQTYMTDCPLLGVPQLPDSSDAPVTADIPTLLLTGSLDTNTFPFRSQTVADALPNARNVVFPGWTHVQLANSNLCAAGIVSRFVADPSAKLDTSCVGADAFAFILPDGTPSQ